jgi:hypothetical protein
MEPVIAILEDNDRRCVAMRECLDVEWPHLKPFFFESAFEMVEWLHAQALTVVLISLDFDLPIRRTHEGDLIDYGSGAIVADYLAATRPTCPILIHSSNEVGASQMQTVLRAAGWSTTRVYPAGDLAWIGDAWASALRNHLPAASSLNQ